MNSYLVCSYNWYLFLRFIDGLALGFYTVLPAYLNEFVTTEKRAITTGLYGFGWSIGNQIMLIVE